MIKVKRLNLSIEKQILYFLSIVFSTVLWFYVLSSKTSSFEKDIEVKYVLPKGRAIVSDYIEKVKFKISGPRAFLRNIESKEDLRLVIDLTRVSSKRKSNYKVDVTKGDLPLPFGVKIQKAEPKFIEIKLARRSSKKVPVKLRTTGKLDENQRLIRKKVIPSEVTLYGAKNVLDKVKVVTTKYIDVSALGGEGELDLELDKFDPRIEINNINEMKFSYLVRPTKANLQINNVKVRFLSSRPVIKPSSRRVSLLVLSEKGEDVRILATDILVVADVPDDKKGRVKVKLKATLPEGIHLLSISPAEIFVTVR